MSLCGTLAWIVRELAPFETHDLRRRVSADGRTDIATFAHPLDEAPGAWHLGATDASGRVVAISSYFPSPCSWRPGAEPAVQLQFMAVEPALQRQGVGSAILAEGIRRLGPTDAVLLWAHARNSAIPSYERFGFVVVEGSGDAGAQTGRPHHIIVLDMPPASDGPVTPDP